MDADTRRDAPERSAVGPIVDPVAPRVQRDRLPVPDVLRGIAILAMLIAHAGPLVVPLPGAVQFVQGNISDVASPLFALVMGMSTAIVVRKTGDRASDRGLLVLQNAIRGALLIVLGLWLDSWPTWIAVVLAPLGATLIIGTPVALLSTRWVLAIAAAIVVVSQPLNALLDAAVPLGSGNPWVAPIEWVFTGEHYRALSLLPFFLVGVALLRHGFRRDRLLLGMLVVALLAYPLRPLYEGFLAPRLGADSAAAFAWTHSGTWLDTLHDVGLVFLTYVVVVALATVQRAPGARIIRACFTPLRALGTVSLSIYVLQVVVVLFMIRTGFGFDHRWISWLLLVVGVSLVGVLWWRFVGKGPIEWALGIVSGRYRLTRRRRDESAV